MNHYNKVERTLVDLVLAQIHNTNYGGAAMILLSGIVLWSFFGVLQVGIWMFVGLILMIVRMIVITKIRDGEWLADDYLWRECAAVVTLALSGIHWGVAAWFFLDPSNAHLYTFVVAFLLGVVTAIIGATSARPHLWLVFAIPEFSIMIIKFISLNHISLAVMCVIFTVGLYFIVRSVGNHIKLSVTKDFENAALLVDVRKAKDFAEQANIEKSRFMAATSHDLRQPLHAQGFLLEALKQKNLTADQVQLLDRLVQSNEALNSLFNSLLEISQLDAGTVKTSLSHHSVREICQQIMNDFESLAVEKDVTLALSEHDFIVLSDPILLGRIFRNLISNAIKYTEKGAISVTLERQQKTVMVSIKDTGIGIAKNQFEHIFEEYTQLNNDARDRQQGVGLGLALVRRMCELLNHDISVESIEGKGSCFKLFVPLGNPSRVIQNHREVYDINMRHLDILLIDDESSILEATESLLAQWECQCYAFSNAELATQFLSDNAVSIDMIISDYRLSGDLNGIECIKQMREFIGKEIPAVLLSGDTDPDLLNQVRQAGFYMLHKPLQPAKLRNAMAILLDD